MVETPEQTTDAALEAPERHPMEGLEKPAPNMPGKKRLTVADIMEDGFQSLDMDAKTYEEMTNKKIQIIKEDELVHGKIVQLTKDEVLVDIGFKSYGVVPRAELLNAETYQIGDEIDVFIDTIEDP
ncbi:MAG: small subunit ribosomal protein, partial [Bacteroidota bacterium]|nr:small subunit ribosomal protein [Bacteroidota bacterium]